MNNNINEALKIFGIGISLVMIIMVLLAFIMEWIGKIIQKIGSKNKQEAGK